MFRCIYYSTILMAGLTMRFGELECSMNNTWTDDGGDGFVPHDADSRQQDAESQQPPWHPGRSCELSTSPLHSHSHQSRNPSYESPRVTDMAVYDQPLESPIANRAGVDDTATDLVHPGRAHHQDSSMGFDSTLQLYSASVDGMMPVMEQPDNIHYSPGTSFPEYQSYEDTGVSGHKDLTTIRGPHPGDHEQFEDRKPPPVDTTFREMQNPEKSNEEEISHLKSPPAASLPVYPDQLASTLGKRPPTRTSKRLKSKPKVPATRAFGTVTGERTSECRLEPSKEELDEAPNSRAKKALKTWYGRLRQLDVYRREHGHTNVPQKYPTNRALGIWVNKQRMERKFYEDKDRKSSLTLMKIEALEQMDFVWAKRKGEAAWELRYKELQKYLKENGDCNVPTKLQDNRAFGRWVSTQRSQYKKNKLSQFKVYKLSLLGFVWTMLPPSSESDNDSI